MSDAQFCKVGEWVEVQGVLLEPSERSSNLPAETAAQPLLTWVKGFATSEVALGADVTITTVTGRSVTGRLSEINPGYYHTFGRPIPELTHVGTDLRARLAAFRAGGE